MLEPMKLRLAPSLCLLAAAPAAFAQTLLLDLVGGAVGDRYGASVVPIGDVNADGIPDLAVGAPRAGVGGEVYVTSGVDGSVIRTLTAPGQVSPPDSETMFGASLCGIGDQDGDGVGDLVIGIPGQKVFGARNGAVQVVSGATGTSLTYALGVNANSQFGTTVAATGDMNGDGLDDLWIGAPTATYQTGRPGLATLLSIGTSTYLRTIGGLSEGGVFGESLAVLPDVDGDGLDDLVVGAPSDTTSAAPVAGSVTAFSGATGAVLYRLEGVATAEFFGSSIAAVPDANADGITDVAIGVENGNVAGSINGRVALVSGADGSLIRNIPGQNTFASFGDSVAGLADLDGDGAGEVLVGEPFLDSNGVVVGAAHVISGATGQTIYSLTGDEAGALLSFPVADVGDLDGDGLPEFAVSSNFHAGAATGAVSVYLGADAPVIRQCQNAIPNSTGQVSVMGFEGTARVAFNRATLRTDRLPPGVFGIYITSRVYQNLPIPGGSSGQLCIGGALGRFNHVRQASPSGSYSLDIDLTSLPTTNAFVAATPGETWHFQTWHRDIPAGGSSLGSNFSDTVGILMR